ncbi:hypothetical protein [Pseudomonas pseudonitroreducens]|uniref:hypothetical protein n=1 Tax=Pseudomonas pseudonitroreducens TaxID=2892326 RepID=UPI001F211621|nr:hypothetical protein [Pseudomonas pseudonitroreducens]
MEQINITKWTGRALQSMGVLFAVAWPVLYLNGRAFHDAYLSYLQMDPSMFPQDVADTLINSVAAWMHVSSGLISTVGLKFAFVVLLATAYVAGSGVLLFFLINTTQALIGLRRNRLPSELRSLRSCPWLFLLVR